MLNGRRPLLLVALALCWALATAGPAEALWSHHVPGTACQPTNDFGETYYRYEPPGLKNTSTSAWNVFLAACPVAQLQRGLRLLEVRVILKDPARQDAWCGFHDSTGAEITWGWASWNSAGVGTVVFSPASLRSTGQTLSGTFRCLVRNGASIQGIEPIWDLP